MGSGIEKASSSKELKINSMSTIKMNSSQIFEETQFDDIQTEEI